MSSSEQRVWLSPNHDFLTQLRACVFVAQGGTGDRDTLKEVMADLDHFRRLAELNPIMMARGGHIDLPDKAHIPEAHQTGMGEFSPAQWIGEMYRQPERLIRIKEFIRQSMPVEAGCDGERQRLVRERLVRNLDTFCGWLFDQQGLAGPRRTSL